MLNINLPTHIIKKYSYLLTTFKRNVRLREITSSYSAYVWRRQSYSSAVRGPWNVLFFGTDNFSLTSLQSLYDEYRAKKLRRLEVVSDFHIGIVVSFGHLIPLNIINSFPLGMINVHASLLPRWRGAAPIIYSLINGDAETGITIMKIMPEKFDIGEVITQERINIHADETLPELHAKLARIGAKVLVSTIGKLPDILSSSRPQERIGITYAPKVTSKISLVKWDEMTAKNVYDLHRGLLGLHPLTTKFRDTAIKLFDVRQVSKPIDGTNPEDDDVPGFVRFDKKSNVLIVTCKGPSWVSIKKVIVSGRSPMSAMDFRNGFMQGKMKKLFFLRNNII
ncbi:PREDICTED: methionyl-tRNA formyltransferase, mitochondrial isoform X2 [Dinoponera quadriceps]|uniref:Methionyl-tRNA formyltransferase, mitochondrial n=1 Tax=Dinoponera quadriceps TaxID=609295 RepID=A0A6P3X741_DINQU|nr:PREDICTED: methionyl-tRNA formyltransferase, mitochondrial isoform X2 [Dinoponera quadriceps]